MDIRALKTSLTEAIDNEERKLRELSLKIHAHPEPGFHEAKASAWLTEYLENNGFTVERNYCELSTSFRATYGEGRPAMALIAEYDALPNIGHACGHNLIAAAAVGAAAASTSVIDRFGGSLIVIGTPAEEIYGGKSTMADRGAFDNLDIAMMVHPGQENMAVCYCLACQNLNVEFFGKAAHASAQPECGINALEALLQSFSGINSLRQHIQEKARIHGIITDGGAAPNIVPAHSAAVIVVRAETMSYLDELKQRVLNCFVGAAIASGARLQHSWAEAYYAPMRNNMVLAELFSQNMQSLGRKMKAADPNQTQGSTDMGNVSQLVPSIHAYVEIASREVALHSPEFAVVAASEAGIEGMLDSAKALAMTVADIASDPELAARVQEEFTNTD